MNSFKNVTETFLYKTHPSLQKPYNMKMSHKFAFNLKRVEDPCMITIPTHMSINFNCCKEKRIKNDFQCFQTIKMFIYPAHNVKMPIIVGILTFMREDKFHSQVYNLEAWLLRFCLC